MQNQARPPLIQRVSSVTSSLTSKIVARLVFLLALALGVWLALLPLTDTPTVVPANGPITRFSGMRAYEHLRVVATEPHEMGSPEHEQVVRYIIGELEALELDVDLQQSFAVKPEWEAANGQVRAALIENIVARIPGTNSSGAVLLASHYDSMPTSNNAADGGIGVATVLETARALLAGPPLSNDVILFFGDGDATPTLGEKAFQSHPWFEDIALGLELEATPKGASAIAFAGQGSPDRTGPISPYLESNNGWYFNEALKVAPHPFVMMALNDYPLHASSLYSLMIDTDMAGLGFVQFLYGEAYHTLLDNPENVEPGSLQHHGGYMLALTQHFANMPLDIEYAAPARVAFNVLPGVVVHYPVTWATPLAALLTILFLGILAVGFWRKRLQLTGFFAGLGLFVVSLVATIAVTALVWKLLSALNPAYSVFLTRGYYGIEWRMASFVTLTVAIVAFFYLGAQRFGRLANDDTSIAAGALVVPLLLAVFVSLTLPVPSYLFVWPAFATTLLLGWTVLFPKTSVRPWQRATALALAALVPLVLVTPPFFALFPTLAVLGREAVVSPVVVSFVLVAILLGTLVPQLQFLSSRRRWLTPALFGMLALALMVGELGTSGFDDEHPRPNQIQYTLNADTGQASWQSAAEKPDAWTQQFFADGYEAGEDTFSPGYFYEEPIAVIRAPAPATDLPAPQLTVLEDSVEDNIRRLRLRLHSPRGAYVAQLNMELPGTLLTATVGGQPIEIATSPTNHLYAIPASERLRFPLLIHALPVEGVEIELEYFGSGPIPVALTDYSNGLPEVFASTITPRPLEYMPAPYDFSDPTVVHTSFVLGQ